MISMPSVRSFPRPLATVVVAALAVGGAFFSGARRHAPDRHVDGSLKASFQRLPLAFEVNRGQAGSQVRYLSHGAGYTFFLTPSESVLALAHLGESGRTGKGLPGDVEHAVLRMKLVGSDPHAKIKEDGKLVGYSNYFVGNDKSKWHPPVTSYSRVRYRDVYPGVDLAYYGNQSELEHDFILKPGVQPSTIRIAYGGTRKIAVDRGGELLLETDGGVVRQKA